MVSPVLARAAKLRSVAILTNLADLDVDYYQNTLIPQYSELARSLDLYVAAFFVGSYDSFLDLNASGTKEALQRFLANSSAGVSICLSDESAYVMRFSNENIYFLA